MVKDDGTCNVSFVAKYVSLVGRVEDTIMGRSLVVHTHEDDLGLGNFPDSKTTGHSGDRMLYGIIGVDDRCDHEHHNVSECSIF
jgi:Cu-Zn family superoxide dismutase